ncbi:hypothetical protein KAR91_11810 [Candidatus Pacearchaeota archaeon]|nr:hypothetical protein [Candidatus Pacearchaeota archaeon]
MGSPPELLTFRVHDGEKEVLRFVVQRNTKIDIPLHSIAVIKVEYSAEVEEKDKLRHEF